MDSLLFLHTPAGVDEYVDPSAALPPQLWGRIEPARTLAQLSS